MMMVIITGLLHILKFTNFPYTELRLKLTKISVNTSNKMEKPSCVGNAEVVPVIECELPYCENSLTALIKHMV